MLNRLMNWLDDMENAHMLRRLDDRMLADMGISRDEIAQRVAGSSPGPSPAARSDEHPNDLGRAEPDRCRGPVPT